MCAFNGLTTGLAQGIDASEETRENLTASIYTALTVRKASLVTGDDWENGLRSRTLSETRRYRIWCNCPAGKP